MTTPAAVQSALTTIQNQTGPTQPKNQPMQESVKFKFETCGDPALEKMLAAANSFVTDLIAGSPRRWLSLTGTSGAGKTFLAEQIFRWYSKTPMFHKRADYDRNIEAGNFVYWPEVAKFLQQNKGGAWVEEISRDAFMVIDDIGAARDNTGFITGELSTILGRRVGKWTILTANLSLPEIEEKIDRRVASRMIRDKNIVVDVDVIDYALRKNK